MLCSSEASKISVFETKEEFGIREREVRGGGAGGGGRTVVRQGRGGG